MSDLFSSIDMSTAALATAIWIVWLMLALFRIQGEVHDLQDRIAEIEARKK